MIERRTNGQSECERERKVGEWRVKTWGKVAEDEETTGHRMDMKRKTTAVK